MITPAELTDAFARGEFRLGYQLQVDLLTGQVVGVEALLRLKGSQPDEFVPVAEESGLIIPLGTWVVEEALRQLAEWDKACRRQLHMSVNLSGRQLEDGFVDVVLDALKSAEIEPSRLTMELTETTLMTSGTAVVELYELSTAGIYISIDDFGTGYSSLAYLRELPVEMIKIDRSFISGPLSGNIDQPVVEAILGLSTSLGMHVVAEGVESGIQACALASIQCQVGQGFLFGPVLPADEVPSMVRAGFDASNWCELHPRRDLRSWAISTMWRLNDLHRAALLQWNRRHGLPRATARRSPPWETT